MCVEMQPLGRTCGVTATGWVTSVWQGTKQPGAELQMRIAWSAVMEKFESNLWGWQIKNCFFSNAPDDMLTFPIAHPALFHFNPCPTLTSE